jgi:lipoprotein NlpD
MTMLQPALSARLFTVALCALLVLAACSSVKVPAPVTDRSPTPAPAAATTNMPAVVAPARPDSYTVRKGDTVYSIANQFGLDPRQVAAWNDLDAQYHLKPDQSLRLSPPPGGENVQVTPIAPGVVESRPLGSAPSLAAGAASGVSGADIKQKTTPSGVKRPYSEANLAALSRPEGAPAPDATPVAAADIATAPPAPMGDSDVADQVTWGWPATGPVITEFNDARNPGINIGGKPGTPVVAAADGQVIFAGQGPRGYGSMVIVKNSPNLLSVYAHNSKILVAEKDTVGRGQKIAEMGDSEADRVELHFEIRVQSKPVDPLKYLPQR